MIVLDTNVVSESMRPQPEPKVSAWLDAQPAQMLFLTSITVAELLAGIAVLPQGKRKADLEMRLTAMLTRGFTGRVLSFDQSSAEEYARVLALRRRSGRSITPFDALIAAISLAHKAILATRNVKDFDDLEGLRLLDEHERASQFLVPAPPPRRLTLRKSTVSRAGACQSL
jgi:toxin FitB